MESTSEQLSQQLSELIGQNVSPWHFNAGIAAVVGLILIVLFFGLYVFLKRKREHDLYHDDMILSEEQIEAAKTIQPVSFCEMDFKEFDRLAKTGETAQKSEKPAAAGVKDAGSNEVSEVLATDQKTWLGKLRAGLSKTRHGLKDGLSGLFSGKTKIDDQLLENIHEVLYKADVGVSTADRLIEYLKTKLGSDSEHSWEDVQALLKEDIKNIFSDSNKPLNKPEKGPWVILVVGVNGVGKTTTIAKVAASFLAEDKSVLFCAADTYRAAAIDQLKVWGDRLGVDVIAHQPGSDPAAVAYDGVKAAKARDVDVLLVDTAGRLHSKKELMDELGKIKRVLGKDLQGAPHETWLVVDSTTGQNALMQIKAFKEVVDLNGLVVTKLDGTAKGGVIIGAADQFAIPIRYVGVGEKASDLREFKANDYANSLFE